MKETTKKYIFNAIASIVFVAALIISGAFAYSSATDTKENGFTVGNVKVELWENFDINRDGEIGNEVFGPEDDTIISMSGENKLLPTQEIIKEPYLKNVGSNSAYVYLMVGVPLDSAVVSDPATGRIDYEASGITEMFSLMNINENWIDLSDGEPYRTDEDYNYYLFAYYDALQSGSQTEPLFGKVKYANVVQNFNASDKFMLPEATGSRYISSESKNGFGFDYPEADLSDVDNPLFLTKVRDKAVESNELLNLTLTYKDDVSNSFDTVTPDCYILMDDSFENPIAIISGDTLITVSGYEETYNINLDDYTVNFVGEETLLDEYESITERFITSSDLHPNTTKTYVIGNDNFDALCSYYGSASGTEGNVIYNLKKKMKIDDLLLMDPATKEDIDWTGVDWPDEYLTPGVYSSLNMFPFLSREAFQVSDRIDYQVFYIINFVIYFADDVHLDSALYEERVLEDYGYKMPINSFAIQTVGVEEDFANDKLGLFEKYLDTKQRDDIYGTADPDRVAGKTLSKNEISSSSDTVLLDSDYNISQMEKVIIDAHDLPYYDSCEPLWKAKEVGYVKISDYAFSKNEISNHIFVDSATNGILSTTFDNKTVNEAIDYILNNEPNLAACRDASTFYAADFTKKSVPANANTGMPGGSFEVDWIVGLEGYYDKTDIADLTDGTWALYYIDENNNLHTFKYTFDGCFDAFDAVPDGYTLVLSETDTPEHSSTIKLSEIKDSAVNTVLTDDSIKIAGIYKYGQNNSYGRYVSKENSVFGNYNCFEVTQSTDGYFIDGHEVLYSPYLQTKDGGLIYIEKDATVILVDTNKEYCRFMTNMEAHSQQEYQSEGMDIYLCTELNSMGDPDLGFLGVTSGRVYVQNSDGSFSVFDGDSIGNGSFVSEIASENHEDYYIDNIPAYRFEMADGGYAYSVGNYLVKDGDTVHLYCPGVVDATYSYADVASIIDEYPVVCSLANDGILYAPYQLFGDSDYSIWYYSDGNGGFLKSFFLVNEDSEHNPVPTYTVVSSDFDESSLNVLRVYIDEQSDNTTNILTFDCADGSVAFTMSDRYCIYDPVNDIVEVSSVNNGRRTISFYPNDSSVFASGGALEGFKYDASKTVGVYTSETDPDVTINKTIPALADGRIIYVPSYGDEYLLYLKYSDHLAGFVVPDEGQPMECRETSKQETMEELEIRFNSNIFPFDAQHASEFHITPFTCNSNPVYINTMVFVGNDSSETLAMWMYSDEEGWFDAENTVTYEEFEEVLGPVEENTAFIDDSGNRIISYSNKIYVLTGSNSYVVYETSMHASPTQEITDSEETARMSDPENIRDHQNAWVGIEYDVWDSATNIRGGKYRICIKDSVIAE